MSVKSVISVKELNTRGSSTELYPVEEFNPELEELIATKLRPVSSYLELKNADKKISELYLKVKV